MKKLWTRIRLCLALSTCICAASALGGNATGNGGDAVVCRDSLQNIISAELFDYYEAREYYHMAVDLGDPHRDPFEQANEAIGRLMRLDTKRANFYLDEVRTFFSKANLIPNIVLTPIQDIRNVIAPRDCAIEQLAVQKEPELASERLYTIAKDIWDHLSYRDQAGLILHEIIYHEAISFGQTDSVRARKFNAVMSSSEIFQMDQPAYQTFLFQSGFLVSPNFVSIAPSFEGIYTPPNGVEGNPHEAACAGKVPGAFVINDWGTYTFIDACLGSLGPGDYPYFTVGNSSGIRSAFVAGALGIYAAEFTDEAAGITDISTVMLVETATALIPSCNATRFSQETVKVGSSGMAVNKNNEAQMRSLQSGQGVCSNAFLVDYHDLTKLRLRVREGVEQPLILKKIY